MKTNTLTKNIMQKSQKRDKLSVYNALTIDVIDIES